MAEATQERSDHVSIDFSGDAYRVLDELAARKNKPKADVLEDALALLRWYQDVKRDGGEVFFEQKDGTTARLIFEA